MMQTERIIPHPGSKPPIDSHGCSISPYTTNYIHLTDVGRYRVDI
jgi:hypothetical protein